MSVKKYFIAIVIPEPLLGAIEDLKQQLHAEHGLKGALRSPAHITLHRPFVWKENKEDALIHKLSTFKTECVPEITLNNFAFFEPRVVYVKVEPNETLNTLYAELKLFAKRELHLMNEWEDLRGFHPHITIANRDLKKPMYYTLQKLFSDKLFSGQFKATGFSLLRMEKTWEEFRHFHFKAKG